MACLGLLLPAKLRQRFHQSWVVPQRVHWFPPMLSHGRSTDAELHGSSSASRNDII